MTRKWLIIHTFLHSLGRLCVCGHHPRIIVIMSESQFRAGVHRWPDGFWQHHHEWCSQHWADDIRDLQSHGMWVTTAILPLLSQWEKLNYPCTYALDNKEIPRGGLWTWTGRHEAWTLHGPHMYWQDNKHTGNSLLSPPHCPKSEALIHYTLNSDSKAHEVCCTCCSSNCLCREESSIGQAGRRSPHIRYDPHIPQQPYWLCQPTWSSEQGETSYQVAMSPAHGSCFLCDLCDLPLRHGICSHGGCPVWGSLWREAPCGSFQPTLQVQPLPKRLPALSSVAQTSLGQHHSVKAHERNDLVRKRVEFSFSPTKFPFSECF